MALSWSIMKDCSCLCWSLSGGGTNQLCDTDEHVPLMQWRRFVYSSRSISIDPPLDISHPGFPPDATLLWLDLRALQRQSEHLNKSLLSETHLWQSAQSSRSTLKHAVRARRRERGCCMDPQQTTQCHVARDLRNGAFSAANAVVCLSFLCVVLGPSLHSAFIFSLFLSDRFYLWCSHTNVFDFCISGI